jgi:hypothetical protein
MKTEQKIKELELKQLELKKEIEALKKGSELPSEWTKELEEERKDGFYINAPHPYESSFIALSKLIILRDIYRESEIEKVDYRNRNKVKYVIVFDNENIEKSWCRGIRYPLSFMQESTRDLFLKNFESLILEAKELL